MVQERRIGTDCEGQWEFPGGKQEPQESIANTLTRELEEELDDTPSKFAALTILEHEYAHAHVRLHTFIVSKWDGEISSKEGQKVAWLVPEKIRELDLLEAAYPLLSLAERYCLDYDYYKKS